MIYFVKTRHEYGPYVDLFKLATLSGYPVIYPDEVEAHDAPDVVFIISPINGEWQHWPQGYTKGRLILYQLEWNIDNQHNTPPAVNEVWMGDKWQAEKSGYRYVPLGSHCGLNTFPTHTAITLYDVAQFSYQTFRRQAVTNQMMALGLRIAKSEGLWGDERSYALMASRLCIHIHQWDNMPTIAPLRWCIAAAHGLPLISESIQDAGIFGRTYLMQSNYPNIAAFAHYLLDPANHYESELADKARNLHNLLCQNWTFSRMIEASI